MKRITSFDKKCLKLAVDAAQKVFDRGINYPIGAVLVIDGKIVDVGGNGINKQKSLVQHAENSLIIKNAKKLYRASKAGKTVYLYSTLEPCIQCLGSCVTNHISRIIYIEKDPHGGACNMKPKNIGLRYKEFWPEIIHAPVSKIPKQIIISYFETQLEKGINIEWANKMLGLLK